MPAHFLLLAFVFTSVALGTWLAVSGAMTWCAPERRRLATLIRTAPNAASTSLLFDETQVRFAWLSRLRPRSPASLALLRRRLVAAGYRADAVRVYEALEVGCAAAGVVVPLLALGPRGIGFSVLGLAAGLLAVHVALGRRIEYRSRAMRDGLPDALDLLVLCLDAGCTLGHAVGRVSEELRMAHPVLAHELAVVTAEIQAGQSKVEAFRNLAERTQVDEIRPLVSMMVQAERLGTGIAPALRTHAATARDKRSQRAEELASKAAIRLLFPLVLCIFPAFYVITLGPVIIHFVRVFFRGGVLEAGF
jgi:tight adherence protein C